MKSKHRQVERSRRSSDRDALGHKQKNPSIRELSPKPHVRLRSAQAELAHDVVLDAVEISAVGDN